MKFIRDSVSAKHGLMMASLILLMSHVPHSATAQPQSLTFVKKSCQTTTYPPICLKTLTPYAASVGTSRLKLCNAALTAAIQAATECSATVSNLAKNQKGIGRPEARAIKECIGDLKHAVYELKQTVGAMRRLGDADREFQWANAKTYASAAITDAETCTDGFLGRKVDAAVKKKIRSCVSGVEKLISNSLSLINHLY
ncbi:pectinesterase inhibitor 4-like [Andrographis paniculata]|uniref:pectinesterase inhibitor 4-like n=1 Tax=Andrographis paniculata TaxID=175694 RepID=UPI0021E860CE|nr:pectinesterase inhibitor 4-like [Andrographis paniculata]